MLCKPAEPGDINLTWPQLCAQFEFFFNFSYTFHTQHKVGYIGLSKKLKTDFFVIGENHLDNGSILFIDIFSLNIQFIKM